MLTISFQWAFLVAQTVGNLPSMQKTRIQPLGLENSLEKGMATHSSILAWRFPWTQEPDVLQSMESQSWTGLFTFTFHFSNCAVPPSLPETMLSNEHAKMKNTVLFHQGIYYLIE